MRSDFERHRTLVTLLVRLIGLVFMVEYAIGVIGHGIDLLQQARAAGGFQVESYAATYAAAWTIASGLGILIGLFLIFKSEKIVETLLFADGGGPEGASPPPAEDRSSGDANAPRAG